MSEDNDVIRGLAIARTHFQLRAILAAMQAPRVHCQTYRQLVALKAELDAWNRRAPAKAEGE